MSKEEYNSKTEAIKRGGIETILILPLMKVVNYLISLLGVALPGEVTLALEALVIFGITTLYKAYRDKQYEKSLK